MASKKTRRLTPLPGGIQYSNNSSHHKDKTLATLGQGNLNILDENNDVQGCTNVAGAQVQGCTQIEQRRSSCRGCARATSDDLTQLNRDTTNTTKEIYDIDRQRGNIDLTIDHRLLSEEGREDIKQNLITIKEEAHKLGDKLEAAFTSLPQDLKDQTGDVGEAILDEIIKSGREPEEALALLQDPAFQDAILNAAHELNTAVENYDPGAEFQNEVSQHNQLQLDGAYITEGGNMNTEQTVIVDPNHLPLKAKAIGTLADANDYLNTLDPNLREAALIGTEVALGGPVKAAIGYLVGEAINATAGEEIGQAIDSAGEYVTDWAMGEEGSGTQTDAALKDGSVLGIGILTGVGMPGRKGKGNRHGDEVEIIGDSEIKLERVEGRVGEVGSENNVTTNSTVTSEANLSTSNTYGGGRFANQAEADEAFKQYELAKNADSEIVLGRLPDTEAGSQLGMTRLDSDNWTPNVNDAFVQGGIDAGKPFYLGSNPDISNYRAAWNALEGNRGSHPQTVFFREMKQLRDAGYRLEGDYMLPPE